MPGPHEACSRARDRIGRYLSSRLDRAEEHRLREHLDDCTACREDYRAGLLVTARLARDSRLDREARRRAARRPSREEVRRALLGGPQRSPAMRRRRLRLLLLPAFVIFLLSTAANMGVPQGAARLVTTRGSARVAGLEVSAQQGPVSLQRGDWCSTSRRGGARIDFLAGSVVLGEDTWVLVELPRSRRLRLDAGRLDVEGPCIVTSELGVVSVERGRARLLREADRLEVENLEGELLVVDSRGEQRVPAGATWVADALLAD